MADYFPLTLGGNVFGWTADRQQSFAVLDAYADAGGNSIDTADGYSAWVPGNRGGESETIIGEWVAARRCRDRMLIATKVGGNPAHPGLSERNIRSVFSGSRRRLGTDHVDVLYTHCDDEAEPIEQIMMVLDALVRDGTVRALGASNISAARLRAAMEFTRREGLTSYSVLQPRYNLVARDEYERTTASVAAEFGLAVLPYAGLAGGFLSGKYRVGGESVTGPRREQATSHLNSARGIRVLNALDRVATGHNVPPAAVALAWLRDQPTVVSPIASARNPKQLGQLLISAELTLDAEESDLLTRASETTRTP